MKLYDRNKIRVIEKEKFQEKEYITLYKYPKPQSRTGKTDGVILAKCIITWIFILHFSFFFFSLRLYYVSSIQLVFFLVCSFIRFTRLLFSRGSRVSSRSVSIREKIFFLLMFSYLPNLLQYSVISIGY